MSRPFNLRIVLVEPEQPRNVGSVLRIAANFGLSSISITRATPFSPEDLRQVTIASSGASEIVQIDIRPDLPGCLAGADYILGTSGRQRNDAMPVFTSLADLPASVGGTVGVVFGRESNGLSSAELNLCHGLLRLPVNPAFPSLNLSHAVAIVLHTWATLNAASFPPLMSSSSASLQVQELFLSKLFDAPGFDAAAPPRLRRLLQRASPTEEDMAMLFNFIKACRPPARP